MADIWKNLLNSAVILPRFPLITGSNPSKECHMTWVWMLIAHRIPSAFWNGHWGHRGTSRQDRLGPFRNLVWGPWLLIALPFTLPLKMLRALPQQVANLLLGMAEANRGQGAQLLYRVRRRDWRYRNNYFLTQLWKIPSFFPLYLQRRSALSFIPWKAVRHVAPNLLHVHILCKSATHVFQEEKARVCTSSLKEKAQGRAVFLGGKFLSLPPTALAHSQVMGVTDMVTSSSDFGSDGALVTYKDNGFLPLLYAWCLMHVGNLIFGLKNNN